MGHPAFHYSEYINTRPQKLEKLERTNAEVSIHDGKSREFGRINEERRDEPNLKHHSQMCIVNRAVSAKVPEVYLAT